MSVADDFAIMPEANSKGSVVNVRAENIGGISETEVDIPPGVTILTGRNATNRTSFIQSIMAAIGSDRVTLKGDANEGTVELTIGGDSYHRTLRRRDGTVIFGGDPYLEDPTVADLFAFLLESNDARRAVVQGDGLRDLIMRPVDTDEINAEIDRLERRRDEVDEQLDELTDLKQELPSLEKQRQKLKTEIDSKRSELAEKESELESMDVDIDETREEKAELEDRLETLRDLRATLEEVRSDIDIQQESIDSLRDELAELKDERGDLSGASGEDIAELDERISTLRDRKMTLESETSDLQNVIQFNEEMLDGEASTVGDALSPAAAQDGDITDQLLDADQTVCWTCGSEVQRERIEETLDRLRDVRQEQMAEIRSVEEEIEDLRAEKQEAEQQAERLDSLDSRIADVEAEIEERESQIQELQEKRDELSTEVETVEQEVEDLEANDFSEVLDRHREANQLEFELGQLESDLAEVSDRIETIEERLTEEEHLQEKREEITDALEKQRTRIDRIERSAVEAFNHHIEEVLDKLDYDNIERIWIERIQKSVRDGRQRVEKTAFELHVVRTTASGTTYEDTVDHLSESEREVTGLIFALAGYLVHDVYETVPFMILDSLEAIDSNRIADLVSHLEEYAEYLVVALLPEDAAELSDEYARITDI